MSKIEKQIGEYLDWCEKDMQFSKCTIMCRKCLFRRFLNDVDVHSIESLSNKKITDWIVSKGHTGVTMNQYTREFKAMLRWFKKRGGKLRWIDFENFPKTKESQNKKVFYTYEQIEKVLDVANDMEWLLISLCFDCGFRLHELVNLRTSDINGNRITFIGKGRRFREVYVSDKTRQRLELWIKENQIEDFLWVRTTRSGRQKHYSDQTIKEKMRKAFIRAGYTNFHPHALRHSFATDLRVNEAPLDVIKDMLGHANISTTMYYIHSLEGGLEMNFQKYKFRSR